MNELEIIHSVYLIYRVGYNDRRSREASNILGKLKKCTLYVVVNIYFGRICI